MALFKPLYSSLTIRLTYCDLHVRNKNLGKTCKPFTPYYAAAPSKEKGFTLLEVSLVLALTSLFSGIWIVPAYKNLLQNIRLEQKAQELFATLQFARITAIQKNITVSVCQSRDRLSCQGTAKDSWIVLMHTEPMDTPQVLQMGLPLYPQQSLIFYGARHLNYVQFQPKGTSYGYSGRFVLRAKGSKITWVILISPTGRVRMHRSYDGSSGASITV